MYLKAYKCVFCLEEYAGYLLQLQFIRYSSPGVFVSVCDTCFDKYKSDTIKVFIDNYNYEHILGIVKEIKEDLCEAKTISNSWGT